MNFVDTNYFLRFFLGEPYDQHEEAKKLFVKAALGSQTLVTSSVVFFEIYWVLSSFYKTDKATVVSYLGHVLQMEFIRLENRDILSAALDIYRKTGFDLEDSYNLAFARHEKVDRFYTFDQKLQKAL